MKIGFIGLGIMGSRMAANLLKSGVEIVVYNRTKDKARELLKNGAQWAESPHDLGTKADVVITMLSTPEVVRDTALGKKGFLYTMKENSIWIDCTTVNPTFTKEIAAEVNHLGLRFIDAPVSGTKAPAENAQLIFLAGGKSEDIDEMSYYLDKMGKSVVYCGENGMGSSMKMDVNLLLGQSMIAFCEAIALGNSFGIDKSLLFETLRNIPVTSPFQSAKSRKIEEGDYAPEFPLQWMLKDLHLAAISAYENNISLPSLNTIKEIFALARQSGFGELDLTAVFEAYYNKK
jgi:3-hydroxyisobutyrate dehydrogenase/glyoxylate/succinic semialdehyde reductase